MNKKIVSGLLGSALLGGVFMVTPAMANEGTAMLKSAGVSGACYVASVYVDGTYRVLVSCRELKMALSPENYNYLLWVNTEDGKVRRLGEIENGKLLASTDAKFNGIFVTAETDSYGNKPSQNVLLTGTISPIDFGAGVKNAEITTAPTPTQKKAVTTATPTIEVVDESGAVEQATNKGIGSALSTVLKIALFGFGALLLVVGVFSFISRKRSL
ncbi:MAG TPA: hypothetical protein PLI45_00155 [Candidatus Woesebacteria bacterium]|nr:hypothetical protein [Candidatus Woesebacteria bacterium]